MGYLKARLQANLTQQQLADKIGISKTHICEIERYKKDPSIRVLIHMAAILNTCPCKLLNFPCSHIELLHEND